MKEDKEKRNRRREWHGYAFMGDWLTKEEYVAIAHYIETGEKLPALPSSMYHRMNHKGW